jgi:hypothetical protein
LECCPPPQPQAPPLPPCDCLECCPPPLPPCDCLQCCPPLQLPIVKARLVPQPPLLPTPTTPPIVVKKLKMPRASRIQKFLRSAPVPNKHTLSTLRDWKDTRALIASF